MHQARRVGTRHILGTGGDVALQLVATHLRRHGGLLDGEHAAEAAALVGTLGLDDLDAIDEAEQVLHLIELRNVLLGGRAEPQLAHAVAGVVEAHLMGEAAQRLADLHHVVKKLHHVDGLPGRQTLVVVAQQALVVQAHESRTAHRRRHDVVERLEALLELAGQGHGVLLETRVGHGLSAARLALRIADVEPQMAQQLIRGHTHFGIDGIYVTGNKQAYFHTVVFVSSVNRREVFSAKLQLFREKRPMFSNYFCKFAVKKSIQP